MLHGLRQSTACCWLPTPSINRVSLFQRLPEPLAPVAVDTAYLATHQLPDNLGFPPSYQEFAQVFGWGRLGGLFLIYVPLGDHPDSWLVRSPYIRTAMDEFYAEMELDDLFLLEPDGYLGLEKSLLPFAMSENGEYLAWDMAKRGPDNELPIYVIASRMGGLRYGGANLNEFVESCLSEQKVTQVLGPSYTPLPPTFEPLALS
jgi:hypothetical protein